MDLAFFQELLSRDSTSGKERALSDWLQTRLQAPEMTLFPVGDGTENLLLTWGKASVVFCTHQDTVPPYLPPVFSADRVSGRGSCDAKGQIFAMYEACQALAAAGESGFALLLLSGEETGSYGAKSFAKTDFRAPYLIVGEPTENRMVSASKGTKSYELHFRGEAFHSGYPQWGTSAVRQFLDWMRELETADFPEDPLLGKTTWNVGELHSDNPQNVLSPALRCRLYFRTTFASDAAVCAWMRRSWPGLEVIERGGDCPARYLTLPGLPCGPVSFGSDAPHLSNFTHKAICGPGSIRYAHRPDEHILLSDIEQAIRQYIDIFHRLKNSL